MEILILIITGIIAYFIGSVSFSYIFTKKIKNQDIREKGSGNAGTTNVLRSYGWKMGLLTLLCDLLKGVVAALIGLWIAGTSGLYLASIFVIVGHNWSVYLKFRGGKGIAATTGVLLVIMPIPTIIIFGVCVFIVYLTKIMSVGSIIGLIASAAASFFVRPDDTFMHITVIIIALLGIFSHRENIKRLMHGDENKLSVSKKNT
jgi:glycerol-3-phosphate acyltransferase PlsY